VVRHTERHIASDPPATTELESLAGDLRRPIEEAAAASPGRAPTSGIAVAGTPTSLAAMEMGLEPYDSERVHGHELTLPAIQRLLSRLASVTLEERREIPGLHPDRAPTIVAGVVILIETMRAFGLAEVRVSEHDILYGVAIDASSHAQ
jgi:exopolyphosphatase/guanosine-5'-triphosphate,3'-diphosphate pyrophosphatase